MKSFFDKPIITTTYYVGKPKTFNLIFQRDKFKRKIIFLCLFNHERKFVSLYKHLKK